MSSFIIDKRDYMKAAGFISGVAEASANWNHHLWLFDYTTNRNMIAEDYLREFARCYEMNALSVQEQYHDAESELDTCAYSKEFNDYYKRGRMAASDKIMLREWVYNLNSFFQSAIYQTEKESYFFQMQFFFGRIITALLNFLDTDERMNFWGSFDC